MTTKTVNKSIQFTKCDEFIVFLNKLKKEKKTFAFNGNINANGVQNFNINWSSEEEV